MRAADVNVIDHSTGQALPVHYHQGEYRVAGQPEAKYSIQIRISRGPRLLAVTSADGLNVLCGETADFGQTGSVFESRQRCGIEGWRKSDSQVAAFVFTASGDSDSARTGKPRDIGVIGVALFRERPPLAQYSPPVIAGHASAPRHESSAELSDQSRDKAAGTAQAPATAPTMERERTASLPILMASPKLGTARGERESSVVSRTQFIGNNTQPDKVIRTRYDSHAHLVVISVIPSPRSVPAPTPSQAQCLICPIHRPGADLGSRREQHFLTNSHRYR